VVDVDFLDAHAHQVAEQAQLGTPQPAAEDDHVQVAA
jgi:hypothetical protein